MATTACAELDAAARARRHRFRYALHAVPRREAEACRRSERALAFRERAAEEQQQCRDVVRIAAEAYVQPVGERDRALAQPQAPQPIVSGDVERRVARVEPVARRLERVVAHRQHAVIAPRQLRPVALAGSRWRDGSATRFAE